MCSTFGGRSPSVETASSTNSSSSRTRSARLCARSKPIVERTCCRSRSSRRASRRGGRARPRRRRAALSSRSCSERKIPPAPSRGSTARSGRATSPTKRESPVRTAQGSPPRSASRSRKEVCSGRCPGVCTASISTSPRRRRQPSANASCGYSALGELVDVDRRAGRARQPAVAGDVVGVVVGLEDVLDLHAVQAAQAQVGLDVPLRVDDGRDPGRASPTRYEARSVVNDRIAVCSSARGTAPPCGRR